MITDLLEKYDIEQINSATGRKYETPDGNKYPSITSVLSNLSRDAITQWRERIGHDEAEKITKERG